MKLVETNQLLTEVINKLPPSGELAPFEAAADRKRLDAALLRLATSLRSAAASMLVVEALPAKMKAVMEAAPVSLDAPCTYAEDLRAALRAVGAAGGEKPHLAAEKYLKRVGLGVGGRGGGGGAAAEEEDVEELAGTAEDAKKRFKCPISQGLMKKPMKKCVWRAAGSPRCFFTGGELRRARLRQLTPPATFPLALSTSRQHLRPHVRL